MNYDEDKIVCTHEKRLALQFRTRAEAKHAARKIRWPAKAPLRVDIMGFQVWVLSDDHLRFLTKTGFALLSREIEEARESFGRRLERSFSGQLSDIAQADRDWRDGEARGRG